MTIGGDSMRIVLLGDLHTYRLAVWPWELLGKSLAGQANLWLNRRKRFDRTLIAPTIARAAALKPDLVLFSGDLTTTARPGEFADIRAALQPLLAVAPAGGAVLVPGNHDVYTFTAKRRDRIRQTFGDIVPATFPFTRSLIGGWKLLAVDSAEPRIIDSRGRIGEQQLRAVETILRNTPATEGVIVLCHYPFAKPPEMSPMKTGHRLLDDDRWREVVGNSVGRVVLIHGHVHCPWLWKVGGMHNVLDVNAGAPTMVATSSHASAFVSARGQGFWEMTLPADTRRPITFTHHMMQTASSDQTPPPTPPLSGIAASWQTAPSHADDKGWLARTITIE